MNSMNSVFFLFNPKQCRMTKMTSLDTVQVWMALRDQKKQHKHTLTRIESRRKTRAALPFLQGARMEKVFCQRMASPVFSFFTLIVPVTISPSLDQLKNGTDEKRASLRCLKNTKMRKKPQVFPVL